MIALISQLFAHPTSGARSTTPSNSRESRESFPFQEFSCEATEEIVSQFMDPHLVCGSVSLVNADDNSLVQTGLGVAHWAQREFGLQVGWISKIDGRFSRIAHINHYDKFDVDLLPVSQFDRSSHRIGLLIIDGLDHFTADELLRLDEIVDSQIVLGLSTGHLPSEVGGCFDQNLEVSWEWSPSAIS